MIYHITDLDTYENVFVEGYAQDNNFHTHMLTRDGAAIWGDIGDTEFEVALGLIFGDPKSKRWATPETESHRLLGLGFLPSGKHEFIRFKYNDFQVETGETRIRWWQHENMWDFDYCDIVVQDDGVVVPKWHQSKKYKTFAGVMQRLQTDVTLWF